MTGRVLATAARGVASRRWLAAVVLGVRGRYAAAATVLDRLSRDGGPYSRGVDPLFASLAASALASHRRQWGGHATALPLDGTALRRAMSLPRSPIRDEDGLDSEGAVVDALLGLAADSLALGRLVDARAVVSRAARRVEADPVWRSEVRLGWVRAELELAGGRPAEAVSPAERALRVATERGAARHRAKSALVLGAAVLAAGGVEARERAGRLVEGALAEIEEHDWRSLAWPALSLLTGVRPETSVWNRSRVTEELYALLRSTDPVGRRCAEGSAWVPI